MLQRFALAAAAVVLTSCGNRGAAPPSDGRPAINVTAAAPVLRVITETDTFTGRFRPVERVEVRARVSGYLNEILFMEGEEITEGETMFQLDPRPFERAVEQADAQLERAAAALELAETSLKRFQEAAATNAISVQELDVQASQRDQADAEVAVATAARASAKLDLEFTTINAPVSGIAGYVAVTRGNYVSGGSPSATVLTTIVSHDPIYCEFEADEGQVLRFTRMYFDGKAEGRGGQPVPVQIGLSDRDTFEYTGELRWAENELDQGTATMRLRALVENPDKFFTPGLFARVRVAIAPEEEVMLVRDSALGFDQSKRFAWVIGEENKVRRVFVDVGSLEGLMRVVKSGLSIEDRIVLTNLQLLRPGVVVTPTDTPMDPDSPVTLPDEDGAGGGPGG